MSEANEIQINLKKFKDYINKLMSGKNKKVAVKKEESVVVAPVAKINEPSPVESGQTKQTDKGKHDEALHTLWEIYSAPGIRLKTVGVVIDASRPYKTPNSFDWVTKLKIIDVTLNADTALSHENKYINVFIFSKNLDKSPVVPRIGDIIYLKRFDVN